MRGPEAWHVPASQHAAWESVPPREVVAPDARHRVTVPSIEPARLVGLARSLSEAGHRWSAVAPAERIEAVAAAAESLRPREAHLRRAAVDASARWTGRAREMIEDSLDFFLGKLGRAELAAEVERATRLEPAEESFARPPQLTLHWLAGNTPWAGLESLVAACLAGSASLVKLSHGDVFFAASMARALAAAHPTLAEGLGVLLWRGGEAPATEDALVAECDAWVAFGDDATIARLESRAAPRVATGDLRFVAHGHRLSAAVLAAEAWKGEDASDWADRLAYDHALEDQDGCLSPRAVYLVDEEGAGGDDQAARRFASLVARAMESFERRWPRGAIPPEEAARVQQLRAQAEIAASERWHPADSTAWTVLLDRGTAFEPAPAARFVWLHRVASPAQAAAALRPAAARLAALGWAPASAGEARLPPELRAVAPGYLTAVGRMQRPPFGWNHDGASDLAWLLRSPSRSALTTPEATP